MRHREGNIARGSISVVDSILTLPLGSYPAAPDRWIWLHGARFRQADKGSGRFCLHPSRAHRQGCHLRGVCRCWHRPQCSVLGALKGTCLATAGSGAATSVSRRELEAPTLVCRDLASSLDMCRALPCRNADIASIPRSLYLSLMRLSLPPTDSRLLKIHSQLIQQPIGKRRAFPVSTGSVKRCVHKTGRALDR
jgi:hypothetical protein